MFKHCSDLVESWDVRGRPSGSSQRLTLRREHPRLHGRTDLAKIAANVECGGILAVPTNEQQHFDDSLNERSNRPAPRPGATSAGDHKTYWGIGEIVMWIRTRDQERVAAMAGLSESDAIVLALFTNKARLDPRLLACSWMLNSERDCQTSVPHGDGKPFDIEEPSMLDAARAVDDLHGKVNSRRVQMTAIRCNGTSDEQIPVPTAELNNLVFGFVPDHPLAPVGLWSRSRRVLVWRSPQFLRADGLRAWPARNTKTAAVSSAILRHLRKIMTPEAPLTKLEAKGQCLAEVPNAYPEAFKKAWAKLEPSYKRGRGKHGPRGR